MPRICVRACVRECAWQRRLRRNDLVIALSFIGLRIQKRIKVESFYSFETFPWNKNWNFVSCEISRMIGKPDYLKKHWNLKWHKKFQKVGLLLDDSYLPTLKCYCKAFFSNQFAAIGHPYSPMLSHREVKKSGRWSHTNVRRNLLYAAGKKKGLERKYKGEGICTRTVDEGWVWICIEHRECRRNLVPYWILQIPTYFLYYIVFMNLS